MKQCLPTALALTLALACTLAGAAPDPEAGLFGRLDVNAFAKPELMSQRPVKGHHVHQPAFTPEALNRGFEAPVYLHVRPGEELRWSVNCHRYEACNLPVLFVRESWFVNVYLPAVGADDGRERLYRDVARNERAGREQRHRHSY